MASTRGRLSTTDSDSGSDLVEVDLPAEFQQQTLQTIAVTDTGGGPLSARCFGLYRCGNFSESQGGFQSQRIEQQIEGVFRAYTNKSHRHGVHSAALAVIHGDRQSAALLDRL